MPDTPLQWHSHIYFMLSHISEPSVLMLPTEHGWSLLHLQYAGRMRLANVEPLQQIVAQSLGLSATALRCVSSHTAHQQLEAIFSLENHCPGWRPPARWRWVTREALAAIPLAVPAHRVVLETCLAEAETDTIPALRAPWARRGWFAQAQAWIATQLARLDYVFVPPLTQVRNWGISCVLRVRTFTGDLYLKAASTRPLFAREAVLVQELAARYPAYMPLPVALDHHQNWLLLADVGPDLRSTPDSQVWAEALYTFGRLQRATATQVDDLLGLGCRDRRLETMQAHLETLVQNAEVAAQLQADEQMQLHHLVPRLTAMSHALADYRVPYTLVHGDLHPGNIAHYQGSYRFFDWTDACIAHPFFDVLPILLHTQVLPDAASACAHMLDSYLELWTAYEPLERLRQVWALAQPLGALHQAISYAHIVAGLEATAKHELAWGISYWLRQVLQFLEPESSAPGL
jgi:Phosphotransferase enzyme family